MNNVRKRAGITAGVVLAGIGLAFPAVAFAEDHSKPATAAEARPHAGKGAELREEHRKELAEALAKDLGVPVDKVTGSLEKFRAAQGEKHREERKDRKDERAGERPDAAALQKKLADRLDQAVKDGKLTRAQADAVIAAAKAGVLPGPGGGPHHQER
ncbi:hypothetical protein OHU17_03870 [Streptomyces goshikiensis]|uniref:Uncharacterized protein n=1 Tax=Streptomyces goshikiensis TaxID=1942 RepID=A0ABZ1REP8_9ACTN|nr:MULTISPECIES: hypothetical protein [Streptomyces]AKL69202.1 hypothetical protein M444_31615 [Streptomyces sp. Mg1]EDX25331.1 hypothetical protein SSAG_05122 [Streptomyces sp. Mg1]MBP0937924.1 hypothetical protein [Streptomyces sp. KCTC 0041BP]OKI28184.1 hypothetical protein A6A28_12850 [Streptomyces sp. CB03578]RPK33218.1 hypothetical protein EES37_31650 [Streptomyces sp. ADI91-18]